MVARTRPDEGGDDRAVSAADDAQASGVGACLYKPWKLKQKYVTSLQR